MIINSPPITPVVMAVLTINFIKTDVIFSMR
jgi:hypothetical protein